MAKETILVVRKVWRMLLLICLWLTSFHAIAQSITVDASLDSLQLLIGEQAKIKLEVSCDAKQKVELPLFNDTIVSGVEIVDIIKADTQFLNNKERMLITQEYIITSFDSAFYYLPPFEVLVDEKPYYSKSLALMVYTMEVDTSHPEMFFGPKTVMQPIFLWKDWQMIIWLSILLIPLLIIVVYLTIRYNDNKPIIRTVKIEPKLPPHQQAIKDIERIKEEKSWQKGEAKIYYTELTDVIRTYIKDRFGFNALEKTSSEIIECLQEIQDNEAVADLKYLFETADLVKFAKHAPMINENDLNLVNALEFVNQTKKEIEENEKHVPTEITIEERRSRKAKLILSSGIIILSIIIFSILFIIGRDIYNLCF